MISRSIQMNHFFLGMLDEEACPLFKSRLELLIKSIPLNAPLKHFALASYYDSSRDGLEGCISRLSIFKRTLLHIELHGINFDLNELIDVSHSCLLKSMHLERYIHRLDQELSPEFFNGALFQIMDNVKDHVESLSFESLNGLPIVYPHPFKNARILNIQTGLSEFESTFRTIVNSDSLRENLEDLHIEILFAFYSYHSDSFRFREKITSICSGKKFPNLLLFSISVCHEVEDPTFTDEETFIFDEDEADENSLSTKSFKKFIFSQFPKLLYIDLNDIFFHRLFLRRRSKHTN
jgi:hypothetical protein